MFDITNERPISLHEARMLPILKRPDGSAPTWGAINYWIRVGIRGIKLEYAMLPRGTVTSELCVLRFVEKLTAAAHVPGPESKPPRQTSTKQRAKQIQRAMEMVAR